MKQPTEEDFDSAARGARFKVLFKPTNTSLVYTRQADPKDIK